MSKRDPVGAILRPSDSSSGDEEGHKFIRCLDGRKPQIHEVWTFGEDGVTHEVHPKVQVDVHTGFVREFATDYVTPSWRRVPMFVRNDIMGSFKCLNIPDFLRTYGPPWNSNILDPRPSWGDQGNSTNLNWGSCS